MSPEEKVRSQHPNLFEHVKTEEEILKMTKEEIIKQICTHHPAAGVDKGYSWYIGGMADTGEWLPTKMHYMTTGKGQDSILREFLLKLEIAKQSSNEWNIESLLEYHRINNLPEPERTETINRNLEDNRQKEKAAYSKIVENIETYLMWGKPMPEIKLIKE